MILTQFIVLQLSFYNNNKKILFPIFLKCFHEITQNHQQSILFILKVQNFQNKTNLKKIMHSIICAINFTF